MKNNKTFIVLIILLFSIGILVGSMIENKPIDESVGDFEDEITDPSNDYEAGLVVNETSNMFVKIAKFLEKIISKGIGFLISGLQKIFEGIFGT